ncbi:MAG: sulfurtransferase [Pseudonocardiales bacterium]|nr:sulfurtransferase [Pseudonocardiales bacterium]
MVIDTRHAAAAAGRPVVLDVRWNLVGPPGRREYEAGHVPGAVHLDVDGDLAGPPRPGPGGTGGRHPLPEPGHLQEVLRGAGVGAGSSVVVYDAGDGSVAARAWWLLRWAGFPADRVAVLDGGWAAWTAAGLPVTTEEPRPEPGDVVVRPGAMPVLDADGAAAVAAGGVLVDARAGARFRGETEPVDPVAGRVPGAVNLPATSVAAGGSWPAPEELRARLTALGLGAGRPEGAYCGSGVTAATVVLAAEHAGLPVVPLYVGSWSDWCADPARPVATGPDHLGSPA